MENQDYKREIRKIAFIRRMIKEEYPKISPYHPHDRYPENPFPGELSHYNPVYEAVRNVLYDMRYDREHFGTRSWNPLGWLIQPGQTILLKPNWVLHPKGGTDIESLLTHGSLIRAILDYVYIALKGKGTVFIADAPLQNANWHQICRFLGILNLVEFYKERGFTVNLVDLRQEESVLDTFGIPCNKKKLDGDPLGYVAIDLGYNSALSIYDNPSQFRVIQYNKNIMLKNHSRDRHIYIVARTALKADVVINLPKLKTHKRAGLTCALKNLIGIIGSKDCLPHHRKGSVKEGGDEYLNKCLRKKMISDLEDKIMETTDVKRRWVLLNIIRFLYGSRHVVPFKDPYLHGSWWGNQTIGRMIADINKIVLYADKSGKLSPTQQRAYFALVDGVIAGEGEGPLNPTPKPCGLIFGGINPVVIDLVACFIMGFNWRKIPTLQIALSDLSPYNLCDFNMDDIRVCINGGALSCLEDVSKEIERRFIPPKGWALIIR